MKQKVFDESDFNSNDGMLTNVWGPSMWHILHTISFNYPTKPSQEIKKKYLNFFRSVGDVLPCGYCRVNFQKNIKNRPLNMKTMKNRLTLSKWLYNLHEDVNTMLGKKSNLSYDDVRNRYEMFRSRCLTKKKKKTKRERGCVKPLYGVKSKCVINIVPKNKRCKSFKIDKRCRFKR
jgi:hypothetical protein